jgi:selenophosphate synthetase-related protein
MGLTTDGAGAAGGGDGEDEMTILGIDTEIECKEAEGGVADGNRGMGVRIVGTCEYEGT